MISDNKKVDFKQDGYVVLEETIDDELIDEAREIIWDGIPESRDDPESLRGVGYKSDEEIGVGARTNEEPFTSIKEQLYEYAVELVGDDAVLPSHGMQIPLNYPEDYRLSECHKRRRRDTFEEGHPPHLDKYGFAYKDPDTRSYPPFTLGTAIYFDDVKPKGGGFTVWPGTHWIAADYFETHSLDSPQWYGRLPAIDDDGGWDYSNSLTDQVKSKELPGEAGTVILYHNNLLHGNGINQTDDLRMAGIMRFSREAEADLEFGEHEVIRDAAVNPWKHWDGMQDVETGFDFA